MQTSPREAEIALERVPVPDALTIHTVEACAAQWRPALQSGSALVIDLHGVTTCDTLGIQLLQSLQRSAAAGRNVRLIAPSEKVIRAAETVGCAAVLSSNSIPPCEPSSR